MKEPKKYTVKERIIHYLKRARLRNQNFASESGYLRDISEQCENPFNRAL